MGTTVVNYHLRNADQSVVKRVLESVLRDPAYCSAPLKGWVSVYDSGAERTAAPAAAAEMHRVAGALSAGTGSAVVGFLLQSGPPEDLLLYVVYDKGNLRDEYSTRPDSFGPVDEQRKRRLAGRAQVIWEYGAGQATIEDVEQALALAPAAPSAFSGNPQMDEVSQRVKAQMHAMGMPQPDTDSVQNMMRMATEQVRNLPPATLKTMLSNLGIPVDNPVLAPLLANPAMFLQAMTADPNAMRRFSEQFGGAPAAGSRSSTSAEDRLENLAEILGLAPERVLAGFTAVQAAQSNPAESELRAADFERV